MIHYLTPGQMVGVVTGSGGAEFAFHSAVEKGAVLFGHQRVHSIARLETYGKAVYMLGRKSSLKLGAIPAYRADEISQIVSSLFDIPCVALPNYLCVTLTPSNSILHTSRLYSIFKDYKKGVIYTKNFLFYEEWTIESSEVLIACDSELGTICDTIPLELKPVLSLKEYYESATAEAMTNKIRGIKAFRGLTSPMIASEGGWVPDINSRYFTADFPYGLKIIKDIAKLFGIVTANIDMVWNWYRDFDKVHAWDAFTLKRNKEDFIKVYM